MSHRLGSLCHGNLSCAQAGSLCHGNCVFTRLLARAPLWRAARVARETSGETVGSPKKLARGNWHASIYGCAVTGARTDEDVGGCLGTGGARKWRLEGVGRGEIVRENVGIRVLGSEL